MSVNVDSATCTGCGSCILSCPEGAVDTQPSFIASIDEHLCTQCLVCIDYCPTDALTEN